MKIKSGFIVRNVGGENIAVPVGERAKTFKGMIKLNGTGFFLWNFFCQDNTEDAAVKALCQEYDVEESVARKDVKTFMDNLITNGFAE
jgi:hypothetical protein